ncbi:hypothetical protein B0J13DRAFT_581816 [Dactylonectria estremocensis]|uniref:Uncharacterized protein n=1 Tax=Dactylonectria estremocensis TaxID=1079267 RepID=A0A9P9FD54_9HYPO|nr:hypothetical protein B0J13DRAFT_581816 [Dactylonectria estremocensis]
MTSFLTVNNNVSLISISIAPSTFLVSVVLFFVFAAFYLPRLCSLGIPRFGLPLPSLSTLARPFTSRGSPERPGLLDKALPEPPLKRSQLVFEDQQQLVIAGQDIVLARRRHYQRQQQLLRQQEEEEEEEEERQLRLLAHQEQVKRRHHRSAREEGLLEYSRPSPSPSPRKPSARDSPRTPDSKKQRRSQDDDERSPRRPRRLATGLRTPGKPAAAPLGAAPERGGHDGRGPRGLGTRFRREDDLVLERAIRTRLPKGSASPGKGRSMSPERVEDRTLQVKMERQPTSAAAAAAISTAIAVRDAPVPENYIRFAVRAEVQQRTEPIESAINTIRNRYSSLTRTWTSTLTTLLVALFSLSAFKSLLQPAATRPAGDLVKVAGLARSFEPLIYYSEHAVAQVHDLQATSVAVWDLGESVRTSDMRDAPSIVADLDALSETMKTLAIEMTKFFARVDGDIDGILNVMDWAKMHLRRLNSSPAPSTLSSAYDNLHNLLSHAYILEDASGAPTSLGRLTTLVFGYSNPQREQRMVQLLFTEFLAVLEDSIQAELQHSVTLFALFEAVDFHFLNLARTVVRESSAQEELHADLLASLWTRLLGTRAAELRKFEQNRLLLRNVRDKTVRNKGILVEHNGKLLTLKASLETLRSKLVSPLVRGVNSTTLTLDDQIVGISDVSEYLGGVRKQQKGKVMESLFASVPGKKYMIDEGPSSHHPW